MGITSVAVEPKAGWTWKTTTVKLATPVTIEGETITDRVSTITWSGGQIKPGEFDEFVIHRPRPGHAGADADLAGLQTYADGKVVHWIGALTARRARSARDAHRGRHRVTATTTTTTAARQRLRAPRTTAAPIWLSAWQSPV